MPPCGMADTDASLPLFPLHGVLVPGAALDLRIFERRYLDMVGECGRKGSGFGVCLILEGAEAGAPATGIGGSTGGTMPSSTARLNRSMQSIIKNLL